MNAAIYIGSLLSQAQFKITIKAAQIRKGFIRIPRSQARELFPASRRSISVFFDDATSAKNVTYNPQNGRIYGVTEWLKQHAPGQAVEVEMIERNRLYRIRRIGSPKAIQETPKAAQASYTLTKKPLEMGFLPIPKGLRHLFPATKETMKITAIFEDAGKFTGGADLTYNGYYQRLYGLTAWYRANSAQIGDVVTIVRGAEKCPECQADMTNLDPVKHAISHWGPDYDKLPRETEAHRRAYELTNIYRFQLQRVRVVAPKAAVEVAVQVPPARKVSRYVGEPLNFRGLMYEPINENGVIFLFGLVARDLGFYVEGIQEAFPDAFGRRREDGRLTPVDIEFKFKSSGYKQYYKQGLICDVIVCWEHDWKDCPIEVIELKSKIKELLA